MAGQAGINLNSVQSPIQSYLGNYAHETHGLMEEEGRQIAKEIPFANKHTVDGIKAQMNKGKSFAEALAERKNYDQSANLQSKISSLSNELIFTAAKVAKATTNSFVNGIAIVKYSNQEGEPLTNREKEVLQNLTKSQVLKVALYAADENISILDAHFLLEYYGELSPINEEPSIEANSRACVVAANNSEVLQSDIEQAAKLSTLISKIKSTEVIPTRDEFMDIKTAEISMDVLVEYYTEQAAHEIYPNLYLCGNNGGREPLKRAYHLTDNFEPQLGNPDTSIDFATARLWDTVICCADIIPGKPYMIKPIDNNSSIHYLQGEDGTATCDWSSFTFENLKRVSLAAISTLSQNKRVVIHCHQGVDRSAHTLLLVLGLLTEAEKEQLENIAQYVEHIRPIINMRPDTALQDAHGVSYFDCITNHFNQIKNDPEIRSAIEAYKTAKRL